MRLLLFLATFGGVAQAEPEGAPPWLEDAGPVVPAADPFAWDVQGAVVPVGGGGRITLRLVVPEGHFVYADRVSVAVIDAAGLQIGALDKPPGERRPDPAGEAIEREAYPADTFFGLPVTAPVGTPTGLHTVVLELRHQGCRVGLCLPPRTTRVEVLVPVRAPEVAPPG